jgi:hypothetical protein
MSRDLEPVTIRIREVPPSLNQLGSGNRMKFWRIKKEWQARFLGALTAAELPHGLARVIVEGQITFPVSRRRDEGNFRFFLEKALGDTLTAGGWLTDDAADRYSFGALLFAHEPGISEIVLTLFAEWPEERRAA